MTYDQTLRTNSEPEPEFYTPKKRDFKLSVKTLSKSSFGSAGCNVDTRIEVTYTGSELDPTKTYEIAYELTGVEDAVMDTLDVTGDQYEVQEHYVSTTSSSAEIRAIVLSVSEF
jgi:hypothetical protein